MHRRHLVAGVTSAALLLAGAIAAPMFVAQDWAALPPEHTAVEAAIQAMPAKLADAIRAAETTVGGIAGSAEIRLGGAAPTYEVVVYAHGGASRVTVDANGSVKGLEDVPRFPGVMPAVDAEISENSSGLRYIDVVAGEGPLPRSADSIRAKYTMYLVNGQQVQSSNDDVVTWKLADLAGFDGLSEGVSTMRYGGTRKLIIPAALTPFKEMGNARIGVPPGATLIIDVELLPFIDFTAVPATLPGWAVTGPPTMAPEGDGLMWYDLEVGEGPQPSSMAARVKVDYEGYTVDGRKFDSSIEKGTPGVFSLGGVVAGFGRGVQGMRVGGKRKIVMPGALGYREAGRPSSSIPPNAVLIFDVELLEIVSDG